MGAVGYANSYISEGRFIEAIKTVESGRVWFGQEIVNMLIKSVNLGEREQRSTKSHEDVTRLETLSEREMEIAHLIAEVSPNPT